MGDGNAAAHFAAILDKAQEARRLLGVACDGEDYDLLLDADEAAEQLIDLILDSPDTPRVMLALGGTAPAGAAGVK